MSYDEKFMNRCLQLAANGRGYVAPNPMVGAVIVYNGKIIGEGFHREYGKSHAEVNAINSVKDKELLKQSTIYVSLEPCSHYGKTPPCSQLIIDYQIPRVVVATLDPYHKVAGRGVNMLRGAGIEVKIGVREREAQELNKEFFTVQMLGRPYIYLKWAQTKDGFIDKQRNAGEPVIPTPISNDLTKILVHKLRSEVSSIMVGTNTAINDNPSLTTRLWFGKNPTRVVLDRELRVPKSYTLYDNNVETIFFTKEKDKESKNAKTVFVPLDFNGDMIPSILKELNKRKIESVLIEGGAAVLQNFIDAGAWDEAYIEIGNQSFSQGIKAPLLDGNILEKKNIGSSETLHLKNSENYKIL